MPTSDILDLVVIVVAALIVAGALLFLTVFRNVGRVNAKLKEASSQALVAGSSKALTDNTDLLLSCYVTRETVAFLRRKSIVTKKVAICRKLLQAFVELNQTANAMSGALARCHSTLLDYADALGIQVTNERNTIEAIAEAINRLATQGGQGTVIMPNIPTSAVGKYAFKVARVRSELRRDLEALAISFNKQLDAIYWLRDGDKFWQKKKLDFWGFPGTEAFPQAIDLASLAYHIASREHA